MSFAVTKSNRTAIRERGWNPLNRILLQHPQIRATMTTTEQLQNKALESQQMLHFTPQESISSMSRDWSSSFSPSPETILPLKLNYDGGTSGNCIDTIISAGDMHDARERINERQHTGKGCKANLRESGKVTAGTVFRSGSNRLGMTVLEVTLENVEAQNMKQLEKDHKHFQDFELRKQKAMEILASNPNLARLSINDVRALVKYKKVKEDGKLATKKSDLIEMWGNIKHRQDPTFPTHILEESQIDIHDHNDNHDEKEYEVGSVVVENKIPAVNIIGSLVKNLQTYPIKVSV